MLVKFFANKQGGDESGIDYFLNDRVEDKTAYVIKGSESITRQIVRSIVKKQKLCMGCLSFEEKDIDLKTKQTIIDGFETILFEDDKDRYNILWVEHIDKARLELNFAIPKIDLLTWLAFNPCYHEVDMNLVDSWQNYTNLRFNLSDPKDPAKAHILQGSRKELEIAKDYIELEKILADKFINNEFSCRDDILKALKDSNIEVTRTGREYISIKLPDSKKAKRFKKKGGGMFHESFTDATSLEQLREETQRRAKEFRDTRDGPDNLFAEQSNQEFTRRSYLFTDEFKSSNQREVRIVKFKQRLSKRDKELNRLKAKLDRQICKRNNWLKEQSSREPKRNSSISDIIGNNVYSDSFSINMELQPLFAEQKTQTNKSKYKNAYQTKHKWQPTIDNKNKIFTKRIDDDSIRAGIISRIRAKREARRGENKVIKRATQRVKEFGANAILIAKESKELIGRIKEFKTRVGYTKFISRAISKIIDLFGESVANCYQRSREFISRVNAMEVKQGDITTLESRNYSKEECLDSKFKGMGVWSR